MQDYLFTTIADFSQGKTVLRRDRDGAIFICQRVSLGKVGRSDQQDLLKLFSLLPTMVSFPLWRVLYITYDEEVDLLLALSKGSPVTSLANLYFEASAAYITHSERELSIIYAQLVDLLSALCNFAIQGPILAAGIRLRFDPSCFWFDDRGLLKCDLVQLILNGWRSTHTDGIPWVCIFIASMGKFLYLLITAGFQFSQLFSTNYLADSLERMQCYTIPYAGKWRQKYSKHVIDLVNILVQPSNLQRITLSFLCKSPVYLFGKDILKELLRTKTDPFETSALHKLAMESQKNLNNKLLEPSLMHLCRLSNSSGCTALQIAIMKGNIELAELLVDEEAGYCPAQGEVAAELAIMRGYIDLAKKLITYEGRFLLDRGYTSLMLAAFFVDRGKVLEKIQNQAKAQTNTGMTALHLVVISNASLQQSLLVMQQKRDHLQYTYDCSTQERADSKESGYTTPRTVPPLRLVKSLGRLSHQRTNSTNLTNNGSRNSTPQMSSSISRSVASIRHFTLTTTSRNFIGSGTIPERPRTQSYSRRLPSSADSYQKSPSPQRDVSTQNKKIRTNSSKSAYLQSSPVRSPHYMSTRKSLSIRSSTPQRQGSTVSETQAENAQHSLAVSSCVPALQLNKVTRERTPHSDINDIECKLDTLKKQIYSTETRIQECHEIILSLIPLEKGMADKNGMTALMLAAKLNCTTAIQLLAKYEKLMTDSTGENALMFAVRNNAVDAVNELINYEATHASANREHYVALHIAAQLGNDRIVQILAPLENNMIQTYYTMNGSPKATGGHILKGVTALMMAAIANTFECALILSKYEAKRHEQAFGYTALMLAAYFNHSTIVEMLLNSESKEIMNNGWTALMIAVSKGHLRCCAKLISYEAKLHAHGITALMIASQYNHTKIASLLYPLEHSIYYAKEKRGKLEQWSCLTYASACGSIETLEFLLEHRFPRDDINLAIKVARTPEISNMLLMHL